ncbi:MAG: hypothetical protein WCD35_04960 [Mycobacteriales bacterium]
MLWQLASTAIAPERDLIAAGVFHAYQDGVGETACGLQLGLDVRLFPGVPWESRGQETYGQDCPICVVAVNA